MTFRAGLFWALAALLAFALAYWDYTQSSAARAPGDPTVVDEDVEVEVVYESAE